MSFHSFALSAAQGVLMTLILTGASQAHFLWLASSDEPTDCRAIVFFGEDAQDRDYHLPDALRDLKLQHRNDNSEAALALEYVDDASLIGLRSIERIARSGVLETTCQYGVYHGGLLIYYGKHYLSDSPEEWSKISRSATQRLDIVASSASDNHAIEVQLFWEGKPAPHAWVSLVCHSTPAVKKMTDEQGKVRFTDLPEGRIGFLANVQEKDCRGTLDGEAYMGVAHFATLTFRQSLGSSSPPSSDTLTTNARRTSSRPNEPTQGSLNSSSSNSSQTNLPDLPIAVSSFGATVSGGWLYVYSGHTGEAHAHSRENLSSRFMRLSMSDGKHWEELPMETPLQGLAMVSHGGMIYRMGGMSARNAAGEPSDLHSSTEFAKYDPEKQTWTTLTPLPAGRSSHDAVVIGDQLYVVGGWNLSGSGDGEWHQESLVIGLNAETPSWSSLPTQPFQSRALAVSSWQDKLVCVGGMTPDHQISRAAWMYDPESRTWSSAEPIPGEGMNGFGVSAWNLDGKLFVSGSNGVVYQMSSASNRWEAVATLAQPRFFHRLLPSGDTLMAIGGASERGHLRDIELVHFERDR